MTDPVTLFSGTIADPVTVILREKYGPVLEIDNVNAVIDKEGSYWITRNGEFFGQYPKANYSVSKKEPLAP